MKKTLKQEIDCIKLLKTLMRLKNSFVYPSALKYGGLQSFQSIYESNPFHCVYVCVCKMMHLYVDPALVLNILYQDGKLEEVSSHTANCVYLI